MIEKVRELSYALWSIGRLFGEHASDQFIQSRRNIRAQAAERWRRLVQVLVNKRAGRSVIERQRVREHLKHHDAERVYVSSAIYDFAEPELLRAGELWSAHQR